jgi:hypothetical protein
VLPFATLFLSLIAGALLVDLLVHAGIHLHALLPWAALLAMLIEVASGVTGRTLLAGARRQMAGRQKELREHGLLMSPVLAACNDCHDSQRPGDVIHTGAETGCNPCHHTEAWTPATFEHERYFRFDRDHPEDCQTCHTTPGDLSAYTCYGCHEHTPRNIRSEHLEEGIREFEACEDCHRSGDEEEAERAWKKLRRKEKRRSSRDSRRRPYSRGGCAPLCG